MTALARQAAAQIRAEQLAQRLVKAERRLRSSDQLGAFARVVRYDATERFDRLGLSQATALCPERIRADGQIRDLMASIVDLGLADCRLLGRVIAAREELLALMASYDIIIGRERHG